MLHIWKIVQCLYLVGGFLPAFKKRMRNKNLLCGMKSQKREREIEALCILFLETNK